MQRRTLLLASLGWLAGCATRGGPEVASTPTPTPLAPIAVPAPLPRPRRVPTIGVALGGGAAKGFAHIGVLKVLEEHGLVPAYVAGTSAGSVVGALYASGMNGFALQEHAFALDETSVRDISIGNGGLIKGEKLEAYINQLVNYRPIEKLAKPFAAVATELDTGARVIFRRGNTGEAVRASCSIPGVFQPTVILGKRYVDGGVVSPVPVDAARDMGADIVIGVDISTKARYNHPGQGVLAILNQAVTIMGQRLGAQELARADVVIGPRVGAIGAVDFDQKNEAILQGEEAAQAAIPEIRRAIARWQAVHP